MSSKQKYQAIIMWPSLYLNQLKILKIFFFLFITFSLSKGQTQIDSSIMSKWLHATINIECQPSYAKERDKLWDLMVAEKISWDEYNRKSDSLYLVPRKTGSAIYLSYNQKNYLITAKHVIEDTTSIFETDFLSDRYGYNIFQKIFLVESPQTLNKHKIISIDKSGNVVEAPTNHEETFIMNIPSDAFEFSSQGDLGIINLNKIRGIGSFLRTLKNKNYIPITISDIDTLCNIKNGDTIFAIGYPNESLRLNKWQVYPRAILNWESWGVTTPVISYGEIENAFDTLSYFYGNIFVYKGFSGGAVVSNNKLIGIVTGGYAELKQLNTPGPYEYIIHHSVFMKSSLILQLIRELESKPERRRKLIERLLERLRKK
jgi:hypothetical protein